MKKILVAILLCVMMLMAFKSFTVNHVAIDPIDGEIYPKPTLGCQ